ncbi:hypothetical protein [Archangium sp.]|uniref:hypothetical protein n=1 Tax=Archangium sp. TaxID=1872627 RepID=UPI002D3CDE08|nr:hypothetical protein [Archangium sp.]HYO55716.1 hypothetical protein [Archangium sp.]
MRQLGAERTSGAKVERGGYARGRRGVGGNSNSGWAGVRSSSGATQRAEQRHLER